MPVVIVKLAAGRSTEIKEQLAKDISAAVVKNLELPNASNVWVLLEDLSRDDIMIGGELLSKK